MAIMDRVRGLFGGRAAPAAEAPEPVMAGPGNGMSITAAQYQEGLAQAADIEMADLGPEYEDDGEFDVRTTSMGDWLTFAPGEEIRTSYGRSDEGFHFSVEHSTQGSDREESWSRPYPSEHLAREAASLHASDLIDGRRVPHNDFPSVVSGEFTMRADDLWAEQRKDVLLSSDSDPSTMQERLAALGPAPYALDVRVRENEDRTLEKVSFGVEARNVWEDQVEAIVGSDALSAPEKERMLESLGPAPALTAEEHAAALEQGRDVAEFGPVEEVALDAITEGKNQEFAQDEPQHKTEHDLGLDFD